MGVGWKNFGQHISYIVSWVNICYFNLLVLYEVSNESKNMRINMLEPINLDESNSYLCYSCNIVFKNNKWLIIFGESTLLYDNLMHGA